MEVKKKLLKHTFIDMWIIDLLLNIYTFCSLSLNPVHTFFLVTTWKPIKTCVYILNFQSERVLKTTSTTKNVETSELMVKYDFRAIKRRVCFPISGIETLRAYTRSQKSIFYECMTIFFLSKNRLRSVMYVFRLSQKSKDIII